MPQYEVSVPGKGTFSVSSPTELTDQQVWLAVQRQLELPEPPAPPPPPEGGFFPSVKRGFLQTQMLVGDVLPAMFGKAIGAEEYAKKQWEEAAETQKRIEREVPAAVPSYKDISSFGDAWVYAKEAVGESLASIIPSLLTGGAAGLLARPAVAAANTAAREAAEKTLMSAALSMGPPTQATMAGLEKAKQAAIQAGIDAAKRTAFRYEVAGGLAGSALQNIPEVYQNIKEETGKEDIPAALIAGGFNAALDTVLPVQLLKKIRGQGLSEKEIMGAWFKRGAAGLGKGFLTEGATEAAQEASSILAENFVAENSDVFNAKNLERVINAGLKGGLGGGVITAATDIATGKAPPPEQTDRQRIEQLQREILGDVQTARSEKALEEAENAKKAAEDAEAARKEAERAPTVPELITIAQGQNAYSALEAEKQRLLGQEKKTKEVKEAIEVIKELQGRLVIEDVTRRAPSVPAEMDDKTIRSLGFVKSENPESVYQQLLGKSTRDPDVTAFLKNYAEAKAKPQTKDRINTFLGRVERAQIPLTAEEIAEGERRAREAVTEPSGAGPSVVGEPGAGAPAAGVGVTQPSGVVPPVAPVGEPPVGEGAAPAPVAPPPAPPVEPPAPPVAPPAPAPAAPPVAPAPAAPPVEAPAAQITFPPVTAITNFRVGPGGVITPRVIAQNQPLYRETNREGLEDILRYEQQADYKPMFVTDDKTLALGQGENKGVLVTFRPNSLSGKENAKPGTGVIGGREYQTDLIAPRSVMSVEMLAKDFGKLRPLVKRALTQFTRNELPDGRLQFVRKGLEEQVPAAPPVAPPVAPAPAPTPVKPAEPPATPTYRIVKAEAATSDGGVKPVWNVVDAKDGYVFDTFDRRKDAQDWVNNAKAAPSTEVTTGPDWALEKFGKPYGSTREAAANYSLKNLQADLQQSIAYPFPNARDQAEKLADLRSKIASIQAALPKLQQMDRQDQSQGNQRAILSGAKQELDAAVKAGVLTPEQAAKAVEEARATGNAIEAAEVVEKAAAPTTITAEQLINLGVKKTQPMIRRIAGKNMGIQADRARVLAELNKYINNKENSPESRENLAKLRDQFEEVGKTVTVAPTKKRKPQQTVMESAMLGRINMVGGLDLSLLSEFSEKKEIGVLGKDDRPLTRWINPMTDKGKLFRSGGMQDYGEIARVLEEAGYMEPGTVERDPTEAGERAKRMILSALKKEDAGQTISEMEEEARRRTEELSKMDQEAFDAENKAEFEAERQAIAEAEGLTLADLDVLEDNIPFLTDAVEQTPERLAADMRAMGFTEEEISDAIAEFSRKAVAAQAPEARAEEAPQAPAAPKAAEELELEAPTAEELAARQKREEDAREAERAEQKRLEQKGRADAERGEFVLTGSDRPADVAAAAGQMDIFTEPSPATDEALAKPDSPKKGDEVSGAIVADALDNANLTPEETQRLESAFNAKAGSKPFLDRLVQEVQKYITKGAQSVAKSLRESIGKIVKAVLGIAVVFNVNTAFPTNQLYAKPQVPAIDVTASKQAALGKLNLNGRSLSPNALRVANWVANTGNNNATNLIMDPASGRMYVMKGAKIVADAPALFGKAGIGEIDDRIRTMAASRMTDADKITPAGKFPIKLEKDASYGTTITFMELEAGSYAIHRVYLGDPKERRAERLASSSPADNNVSYGCINVSNEFYDNVLSKLDLSGEAFAYLLPSDPKKLEKVLPTVPRYSLAEAVKTPSVALPKETQAKIDELSKLMQKMLGKMGLKNVALNLAQDLERNGEYANRLITLALDATNPVRDLRHESLHAMKELGFFSDAQWATLTKMARDKWIDKYLKSRQSVYNGQAMSRYDAYIRLYGGDPSRDFAGQSEATQQAIYEEAIADAFGDFDATKAPPGLMQAILFRMREFFRNIKEAMGMANIDSAEDIFRRVERGELKETAPAVEAPAKASLRAPETEAFKRWFGDSKVVDENGQPLVVYHGSDAAFDVFDTEEGAFFFGGKGAESFAGTYGDNVIPAYLSIKKPFMGAYADLADANFDALAKKGYDGAVFVDKESGLQQWVAFNPKQIKRADGATVPARASLRDQETEEFKKWSGGAPVVRLGKTHEYKSGQPIVVEALHGTTNADITEFKRSRANIESDFGAGFYASNTPEDVAINYANLEGADLTRRVETLAERIAADPEFEGDMEEATAEARKRLSQGAPNTMKLYMRFKNPAVLGGKGETFFDYNPSYNEETDEYGEPTGLLVDFVNALDDIGDNLDISMRDMEEAKNALMEAAQDSDGLKLSELSEIVKDKFADTMSMDGDLANGEVLRQALEKIGFDGVVDTSVYKKFGPRVIRGAYSMIKTEGMSGLYADTVHFVAFKPVQIKSATGNIGTYDVTKPDIRYSLRDAIGLYSELENKIAQGPNAAPAPQWKAYIKGLVQKGVKPEEIEWSGVNDWLDLQTGRVSKEALNDYLKQGGVRVEETVLGGYVDWTQEDSERLDDLERRERRDELTFAEQAELARLISRENAATEAGQSRPQNLTKYGQYTLPGGENYREVLLTLPRNLPSTHKAVQERNVWYVRDEQGNGAVDGMGETKEKAIEDFFRGQERWAKSLDYRSSHWDQPNVLAHIRVNDRTDADGKRVLFVEEIQSDWGQEGKKKGFRDDAKIAGLRAQLDAATTLDKEHYERLKREADRLSDDEYEARLKRQRELEDETQRLAVELDRAQDEAAIPSAPFVTKTEGWLNLALKRIMVMAAEGGYDKVAFVNGDQSADRFSLDKQVDELHWRTSNGLRRATLDMKSGDSLTFNLDESGVVKSVEGTGETRYVGKGFDEIVGKELAEKVLSEPRGVLSGNGLKVGGEGMKTFYDTIVPTAVKKLLPKVGGGQMSMVEIDRGRAEGTYDKIKPFLEWMSVNHPGYTASDVSRMWASGPENNAFVQEFEKSTKRLSQPGFDVTPDMKQKVQTTGLPRFSLRDVPRANLRDQLNITTLQRIEQTTVAREEKGFVQRITEAISPKNFGFFRQQALNRYEGLSRADRMKIEQMGGVDLLADAGAESAALLSDMGAGVTASALGVHDRKGGAPVYNHYFVVEVNNRALAKRYTSKAQAQAAASAVNGVVRERGYVTVSNFNDSVKGPVLIFAPLMEKYKDPMIFQAFQFYSAAKRGARFMYTLDAKGNVIEKLFTADDINIELPRLEAQFPEFKTVHAEWIKYNDKLVDYMRDTGVISEQNAQTFKMHGDYFPFYRQIDGQDDALGPRIFQSISAVKPPKKLKGSELALGDFLENIVRNTQSAVQAGVKNVAARRAAQVGMDVGIVSEIAPGVTPESANSFYVLENGLKKYYDTRDQLFIESIKSLNLPDMPFIGMLAGPANLLRNLVTKDPGFILANLMRDSLSAWTTSGVKMTPIVDTMRNFAGALVNQSPEYKALLNAGVIGGYEFSQNIQTSGKEFGAAIRKTAGVPTFGEKIAKPFTSVWETLEKATTASDAATRMEIYKRTLAETGNEAEAIFRALEVMNFNRKGSSAVIRILTAAVPFLNARMQGLDILYRAAIAPTVRGDTSERARQVQKTFFVRGAYLMALSAMYWLLTHDDEEYKKQEQETRDNYWLLPSLGVKIPIPFEVGVLFKVIPERILAYTFGDDTGRDFLQSMKRQLLSTLAFNPIPQTVLPLVETVTNFSFFTWRPIIPQGLENVAPEYQVGPGTSKLAEGIGKTLNLSPMRIDQLINGYTGTMGMYAVDLMDAIYNTMTDSPKPSKRFEQMPVIRRFAVDPEARGTVTAYYDLKNAVDQVVRTENLLERTMDYENWGPYMQENMKLLASKDYVSDMEKTLKELREMKTMIRSSTMSADAKRDAITQIGQMENALTANIQQLKKMFRE